MLEIKSTDDLQSSRLNSIESLDKTQNERLNKIEALNELQSTHLTQHDEALSKQATDLSSTADAIRQEEKERAAEQQKVDEAQTAALNKALEEQAAKDQKQDTAFENYQTSQKEDQDAYRKAQEKIDSDQNAAIEKALADRLKTAEDTLKETKEKNDQLEGLLRVYAAATSQPTVFTLFRLDSKDASFTGSPNNDDIFNLLNGSSAKLIFNIEDDPNWSAPAYSELLFNGAVVSNKRSYEGTVNSDLTVKHRNTLTGKESATKTIRFVDPAEPDKNPTGLSWLITQDPDGSGILKWSSHFSELTAAATSQNNQYGWYDCQQTVQYSRADKDWTPVSAPYNLSEMFGNKAEINLRVVYTVYDRLRNSKEFIINLGTVNVTDVRRDATYRISDITTYNTTITVTNKQTTAANNLSAAFNGSFTLNPAIGAGVKATFVDEYNIRLETGENCSRTDLPDGRYQFTAPAFSIYVTIEKTPTIWYTVD